MIKFKIYNIPISYNSYYKTQHDLKLKPCKKYLNNLVCSVCPGKYLPSVLRSVCTVKDLGQIFSRTVLALGFWDISGRQLSNKVHSLAQLWTLSGDWSNQFSTARHGHRVIDHTSTIDAQIKLSSLNKNGFLNYNFTAIFFTF